MTNGGGDVEAVVVFVDDVACVASIMSPFRAYSMYSKAETELISFEMDIEWSMSLWPTNKVNV